MRPGQPYPSTVYDSYRAKVSDGKSVRVTVPTGVAVEAQQFYLIDGFFGAAFQSGAEGDEVILNIEQAEYETNQINPSQAFAVGALVYWDATENRLTTTATGNRLAGRITSAKDANNVVWFILGPQV